MTRYAVPRDALHVSSHDSGITGVVRDIGTGGLSFDYTPVQGKYVEPTRIDIIHGKDARYCVKGISCRTVYNIPILSESMNFRGAETRRCGLAYQPLTEDQILKITSLCEGGTQGPF